ncbi:MAG TPA: hypothetical protein VM536_21555, partial [Chloroflexia bacterium]|nr:hypothetical protein [Chloroflexia bacterium]
MNLSGLLPLVQTHPAYGRLAGAVARALQGPTPTLVAADDLLDAAKPYLLAALAADPVLGEPARRLLVITGRPERARQLTAALELYASPATAVRRFPAPDLLPYERIAADPTILAGRLAVLEALAAPVATAGEGAPARPLIVASAMALVTPTIAPGDYTWATRTLRAGDDVAMDDLLAHWVDLGYQPAAVVESPGTFSRRGGIVDVWPPTGPQPVRLEFWGDTVESLRAFDPQTQRSSTAVPMLVVPPSCELPLWRRHEVMSEVRAIPLAGLRAEVREEWEGLIGALEMGEACEGRELFTPYFRDPAASLLDYLGPDDLVVVDGPEAVALAVAELERSAEDLHSELVAGGELPTGLRRPYLTWDEMQPVLEAHTRLTLGALGDEAALPQPEFAPGHLYAGDIPRVIEDVQAA